MGAVRTFAACGGSTEAQMIDSSLGADVRQVNWSAVGDGRIPKLRPVQLRITGLLGGQRSPEADASETSASCHRLRYGTATSLCSVRTGLPGRPGRGVSTMMRRRGGLPSPPACACRSSEFRELLY
jgi:hypothetical protein